MRQRTEGSNPSANALKSILLLFSAKEIVLSSFQEKSYYLVFKPNVDKSETKFMAIGSGMP